MNLANKIRASVIDLASGSLEGHIASSFSIVEILLSIHANSTRFKEFDPKDVVLSKGHASYAYYAFLHHIGLMSLQEMESVGEPGSKFYGHLPYIENDNRFHFGSGSLGHGLPYSVGLAHANKIFGEDSTTYCVVGDGEANEGTFWESLLLIEKLNIKNFKILIDCNGSSERAIPILKALRTLKNGFKNINFVEVNGHCAEKINQAMILTPKCQVLLCETIKGYPISFMQNNPIWHHRTPSEHEIIQIKDELK